MSFQYINPYFIQKPQAYAFVPQMQMPIVQSSYVQNPYQASFYNQGIVYPYSPVLANQTALGYIKTGEILSPSGEITHMYRLNNGHEIAIMPRKGETSIVKTFVPSSLLLEDAKGNYVYNWSEIEYEDIHANYAYFKTVDGEITDILVIIPKD